MPPKMIINAPSMENDFVSASYNGSRVIRAGSIIVNQPNTKRNVVPKRTDRRYLSKKSFNKL